MQRLWSRTASAQSTCRCVSCFNTGAAGVTSRGATAASKRRLRIGNSVTALYSSIFATAALADAQAKDKRRVEWEQRIAAVKEDVNVLVDEEQRLLANLESQRRRGGRRSVANGTTGQSRSYSTAVPPADGIAEDLEDAMPATDDTEDDDMGYIRRVMAETDDELEGLPKSHEPKKPPKWLSGPLLQQKAIRLLALKQLAIRFLLRPSIAHNYSGLPVNYTSDFEAPRLNVSRLLGELNRLRLRIRHISENERENIDDVVHDLRGRQYYAVRQEKLKLDSEVERDTNLYLTGRMPLQELLLRLASNLSRSTDPDRPLAFKIMLLAFTQTRQNDLGDLLLETLLPHGFQLTSPLIISILNFFRKKKDLKTFDLFLRMLRGEGYPVNLGKMPLFRQKVINGIDLTVPPLDSSNPVLYGALITATLRFNQPERADAFFQAARATGYMDDYNTLFAFLRFYAIRKDWWNGLSTLKRAVAFMGSTSAHIESLAERLIFFMVHVCDACEQPTVAEAIIMAAMDSGFEPTIGQKQWDMHISADPLFERWQEAANSSKNWLRGRPLGDKCFSFADMTGKILMDLAHLSEADNSAWMRQKRQELFSGSILSAVLSEKRSEKKQSDSGGAEPGTEAEAIPGPAEKQQDSSRLPDNVDLGWVTTLLEKQSQEIVVLKRDIGKLQETLSQTLGSYKSQLADTLDQRQAITALQTEVRDLRKISKIAKESYQAHIGISNAQDKEIQSLRGEIEDLRNELAAEREAFAEGIEKQNRAVIARIEGAERKEEYTQFGRPDACRGKPNTKSDFEPEPQEFNAPKVRFMFNRGGGPKYRS